MVFHLVLFARLVSFLVRSIAIECFKIVYIEIVFEHGAWCGIHFFFNSLALALSSLVMFIFNILFSQCIFILYCRIFGFEPEKKEKPPAYYHLWLRSSTLVCVDVDGAGRNLWTFRKHRKKEWKKKNKSKEIQTNVVLGTGFWSQRYGGYTTKKIFLMSFV